MDPVDLDAMLDRELKGLPAPRAPRTLMPRILAATVEQGEHAASPTGWSTWSRGWQIGTVAALLTAIAAIAVVVMYPPVGAANAARTAGEAATVVRVFWEVLLQPVATYMFVLGLSLALACAGAWAALEVALGGATHR